MCDHKDKIYTQVRIVDVIFAKASHRRACLDVVIVVVGKGYRHNLQVMLLSYGYPGMEEQAQYLVLGVGIVSSEQNTLHVL